MIITLGRRVLDSWLIKRKGFTTCVPSWSLLPRGLARGPVLGSHPMSPRAAPSSALGTLQSPRGLVQHHAWDPPQNSRFCPFGVNLLICIKTKFPGEDHTAGWAATLFIIYLFIYFWLCWVFIAVHRLYRVSASGGYSSLQWGAQATGVWASVIAARRLASCSHGLSSAWGTAVTVGRL